MTVMLDPKAAQKKLASQRPDELDGFGSDGARVMDELIRLGVLNARPDGRIDVPDIYRYGFDIE